MKSEDIVTDAKIQEVLSRDGWTQSVDEGRLMLAELMLKAGSGCYTSYTETHFANSFDLLKRDRTPNKKGLRFLCSMFYNHSNLRPLAYSLMGKYRK